MNQQRPRFKKMLIKSSQIIAIGSFAVAASLNLPSPAIAGSFPGLPKIIMDGMPCGAVQGGFNEPSNCIVLRERVNVFQGFLGNRQPAIDYCQQKYGGGASVVWKFGLRWCATPYQQPGV
jgi:hypothetical protein